MKPSDYTKEAGATDERDYSKIQSRMSEERNSKLLHYALGIGTEAGEIQDAVKKLVIYGKELDETNVLEEVGDSIWYMARLLALLGSSFEEVMATNNAKLKARYGDKFTEYAALNRDLDKEREILEG